jgi:predicted Zn-dependent peptidase
MIKKKVLNNGLTVLLKPLKEFKSVTVLILVKAGSRYENSFNNGISHFIEHMLFKGTEKRETPLDISKELDSVGASYNAFTRKDITGYYIKVDFKKIFLAIDILSDILINSQFVKKEIEREKNVVIEEINMNKDNPMLYASDLFDSLIYKGHSLGMDILGTSQTVEQMDRKKIVDYFNNRYVAQNIVVAVSGNFEINKTIDLIKQYFKSLPSRKPLGKFLKDYKPFKYNQQKKRFKYLTKEGAQIHTVIGFPSYGRLNKKIYPLILLAVILGGNSSSRLFIDLREKEGLCYYLSCSCFAYVDTGDINITGGFDKNKIQKAIDIIMKELENIKKYGVKSDELQKAKDYLRGKMTLKMENSSFFASFYAENFLLENSIISPLKELEMIYEVTEKDILNVANEIFLQNKINCAMIGPKNDLDKIKKSLIL